MRRLPLALVVALVALVLARIAAWRAEREQLLSPVRDHPLAAGGEVGDWLEAHDPGAWTIQADPTRSFRVSWIARSGSSYSWTETPDPIPLVEAESPAAKRLTPDRIPP